MSVPPVTAPRTDPGLDRRRAWRLLGLVALVVALYLALWIAYTNAGLVRFSRMEPTAPGASARVKGADFRLLSLVATTDLVDQGSYPEQVPLDEGTVWVIADIEVTRHEVVENFVCSADLIGPGARRWDAELAPTSRTLPTFCDSDDLVLGQAYRFTPIYSIPVAYADQLLGLVVTNADEPIPVLRPPG